MFGVYKTINRYFWKSITGPFILFVFSIVWLLIISYMWNIIGEFVPTQVLPTAYSAIICFTTIVAIPMGINDLRGSIILKKLGASQIKPWMFLFAIISFYFVFCLIAYIWEVLWSYVILLGFKSDVDQMFYSANYFYVFYSFAITYLMGVIIGIFISTCLKKNFQVIIVGTIFLIVSIVLSGYGSPITLIHQPKINETSIPILSNVVYIDPFWYTSAFSYEAWLSKESYMNILGSSPFNPYVPLMGKLFTDATYIIRLLTVQDKWANIFVPLSIIFGMGTIDVLTFKWSRR